MKKSPLSERLKYRFDNFISQGTVPMISGLGVFSLVFVVVFAGLLLAFGLHPDHTEQGFNFFDSIWVNLTHVLDPGTVGEHLENWPFRIFMMLVTVIGLVVISTLIGLVSNGILTKLEELRKGRSFVIENDHVLILGWSSKIFTIISELVIANENQKRGVIVILADKDKVEMEDEIRDKVGSTKNTDVICRTGNPIDVHDLYIANPFDTKSIIILDKDNENSDSQTIKTIVAIVTNPDRREEAYHITAEMEDKKNFEVAKMVGKNEVELILSDEIISRIMVQTSRQSGLSVVYMELMDFDGAEIYFMEEPTLVGKSFREILFAYEDSAIMGIQFADDHVEINPPMDTIFQPGDRVIGITEDDDTLIPNSPKSLAMDEARIVYTEPDESHKERILIVGWNNRAQYIIRELDYYVPPGSTVEVVSKFDDAERTVKKMQKRVKNISLEFEVQDTTDRETLENMHLERYDYIILLCYQNYYPIQEADAQTLITLLHLRNFTEKHGHTYKIVSEMLDIRNRQLADITSADDFIVSDKLVSLLMSQVSENKFLMRVFEDLFDADGSEIYIKPAKEYVQVGDPINFYTIMESAARKNEVAIGYRIKKEARDANKQYGVYVNPKKSEQFTLTEDDLVIVLSED
ncbi:MAG: NAD-binding protein [Cytophagales bacterium]|nr:NAD-binding protein [Cytophagales bacterium]